MQKVWGNDRATGDHSITAGEIRAWRKSTSKKQRQLIKDIDEMVSQNEVERMVLCELVCVYFVKDGFMLLQSIIHFWCSSIIHFLCGLISVLENLVSIASTIVIKMDKFGGMNKTVTRKRSNPFRRPDAESKVKKLKLKVGGVTHTIHRKNSSDLAGTKSSYAPSHTGNMLINQGKPDDELFFMNKQSSLRGVPWKNFSKSGFGVGIYGTSGRIISGERILINPSDNAESTRKSKRAQKRRLSRGALDDDDNDDEIRYLKKLNSYKSATKFSAHSENEDEIGNRKHRSLSGVLSRRIDGDDMDLKDYNAGRTGKESRKLRLERHTEDTDYADEEEALSDTEPRLEPKKKIQVKEMPNVSGDSGQDMTVTTRRRALMSGSVSSVIEFPNGLPPAPSKKQKEQLSEVDQQLRRAEALQRRRMQVEKANRESEAEAIRKILGQDSSRKKREEIVKKRQEERTASYLAVPSNAVRWVMGPSGTVVIFPEEIGLPSIFEQKYCSYPPAREKCAGPSCLNDYKYRDSKSKLPLCSLLCYKAIHEKNPSLTAC
ncbi:hypothetical protein LIER_17164 [Lithospermum erythrorhizon]|uniref:INO80 complex subunit B-like conserved region domain-containing protein n=1 Tax=Lithospermum erythrorhizon TaxID=34254 RepID=A0AAV3QBE8_LITER